MKNLKLLLLTVLGTWMAGSAWAIEPDTDGVYQIGDADQLIEFANMVNGDASKSGVTAKLTADIDLSGKTYVPIGRDNSRFWGTFDGQGHRIKNMSIQGSTKELGLFSVCSNATIKNLILDASCVINSGDCTAALVGCCNGSGTLSIENVGVECNVTGTGANAAAFVGCNYGSIAIQIKNCYNTGNVTGGRESAIFSGWFGNNGNAKVENCWSTGKVTGQDGSNSLGRGIGSGQFVNTYDLNADNEKIQNTILTGYDADWLTSGKLCYTLNGDQSAINWYQNLTGTVDAYPVPFSSHSQVYANGQLKCDGTSAGGELTYSNSSTSIIPPHSFEGGNGWCTVCNTLNQNYLTAGEDDFYSIGSANDLKWFAEYVNLGHNTINGKLTADIPDYGNGPMIGNADHTDIAYKGTFDGQGHTVILALNRSENHGALFMYLYSGAVVKNLITYGTITMTGGKSHGSGIFSGSRGETLVENCVSYVTITSDKSGDATIGGIGAFMFDNGTIRNCAFLGTINAENADGNAGILGYANGGSRVHVQNCYVNASITVKETDNSNKIIGRGDPTIVNCYYVGDMGHMQNFMASDRNTPQATEASADQMSGGELAFLLNQNQSTEVVWYQVIGTDDKPLPFVKTGGVVYANGALYCDGTAKPGSIYSNVQEQATQDDHTYNDWGFCSRCDAFQPDFASQDNAGYYLLDNAKKINWFAVLVDGRETLPAITATPTAKAKLTEDIDFQEDLGNDYQNYNFPGIGTSTNKYHGIFDGQGHVISNLIMNRSGEDAVGFFRYVTSGGTVIKRFTIDNTCSFSGKAGVGAFVGRAEGQNGNNDLLFEELGNEASVTASGANGGGILGVDMYSHAVITMKNCYNAGAISSDNQGGALSGWLGDNPKVINCYNMGTITNGSGLYRSTATQNENTFSTTERQGNCGDNYREATTIYTGNDADKFSDGTVFTKLFAYNDNGVDGSVWRMDFDATTPHPVLYGDAIAMREDCQNRMVAGDYDVKLYRSTKANSWITFCVPFAMTDTQIETMFGEGAKVKELDENIVDANVLHFTTASTIAAGKAYLVKPTKAVTDVTFNGVTVSNAAPSASENTTAGFKFIGVYSPNESNFFTSKDHVISNNNFMTAKTTTIMKGFRAYLHDTSTTQQARTVSFVFDDEGTTGIIMTDGTVVENGNIYNLSGQKMNQVRKGLYIVNGKKYIK